MTSLIRNLVASIGSIVIFFMALIMSMIIKFIKTFRSIKYKKDPFHNSRAHPLNDADAPRG